MILKDIAKIFGTLASLAAGWLGSKLVTLIWKKSTGEVPPSIGNADQQQQEKLSKVLSFAVISGASATVIQAVTKRWTRKLEAKA